MSHKAENSLEDEDIGFNKTDFDVTSENIVLRNDDIYKINHSYEQAPIGVGINLIAAILLSVWLWSSVPHSLLVPWLFFISCNTIIHFSLISQYKKSISRSRVKRNWAFYNGFLFVIYAIAWGIGYHLVYPYLEINQQILLYYLSGIYLLALIPILSSTYKAYLCVIVALYIPLLFLSIDYSYGRPFITSLIILSTGLALGFISKAYQITINKSYSLAMDIKRTSEKMHREQIEKFNQAYLKKITRHKTETRKIIEEKEHVVKTLTSIGEAILTTDADGKITYINPVAEVYLGWDKEYAVGQHIDLVLNIFEESNNQKIHSIFERCMRSCGTITGNNETKLLRKDRVEYYIDYSISPIIDSTHNIIGTVMVFRDVTEERGREKVLEWQANHDQLTGLLNRREFENRLNKIIRSKNPNREHALCYIDLDHFKIVNDTCGHNAGDELLKQIAQCLKNKTRDTDTLARLGGDEFGLIMYSCSLKKAELLAEVMRKEVENIDFHWDNKLYKVSASIGVIAISDQFNNLEDTLRSADSACYNAKGGGRNKVNILDLTDEFSRENTISNENLDSIQSCLHRESFQLQYQEIKSFNTTEASICELLIRAEKNNGNVLLPEELIPVAKRYHLMSSIDRWIVRHSFEFATIEDKDINPFSIISINVSEQSINDHSFLDYLLLNYNHYSITSLNKNLCIDIPESCLIEHFEQTSSFIQEIKKQGFLVAIDDFHSALNGFKKIESVHVDFIKFDGRLTSPIDKNNLDHKILKSIIDISHHIEAKTIAKYVETEENAEALKNLGTDYIQGFLFSEPQQLPKLNKIDKEFEEIFNTSDNEYTIALNEY